MQEASDHADLASEDCHGYSVDTAIAEAFYLYVCGPV